MNQMSYAHWIFFQGYYIFDPSFLKDLDKIHQGMRKKFYDAVSVKAASVRPANSAPLVLGILANTDKNILKAIGNNEDFQNLMDFLEVPKKCIDKNIEQSLQDLKVTKQIDHIAADTFKQALLEIKVNVLLAFQKADKERSIELSKSTTTMENNKWYHWATTWMNTFCEELTNHAPLMVDDIAFFKSESLKTISSNGKARFVYYIREMLIVTLEKVEMDMETFLDKNIPQIRQEMALGIQRKAVEQSLGCLAQCPFCKALCMNSNPKHGGDHKTEYHRPLAVAGQHWPDSNQFNLETCSALVQSSEHFQVC